MTFIPSEETETEEPKAKKPKVEQPSSSSVTFRVSCKLAGHAANKLDAQVPCKSDFENLHKPKILLASRLSSWPLYTPNEFVYCSGGLQVLRKGPAREVRLESEFEKPDTRGKVPTRQGWRGGDSSVCGAVPSKGSHRSLQIFSQINNDGWIIGMAVTKYEHFRC